MQKILERGISAWLDAGAHESLLDAVNLVRTLTQRARFAVGSPTKLHFIKNESINVK